MRRPYPPLRSRISVHEPGVEDRLYEATTDERDPGIWGIDAKQLAGPPRPIKVMEGRYSFWGAGPKPEHPSRAHFVVHEVNGEMTRMDEIRGGRAAVRDFKRCYAPGQVRYFIHRIGIVQPGES